MKKTTSELTKLPNIGETLAEKLALIGINSKEELQSAGTENTFIRLKAIDSEACLSMLCAIDGAIQGIRWHQLNASRKVELKEFLRMLNLSQQKSTKSQ